ncbi:MAG: glycerol-3-phosphate acyltransferase [Acidimicrobiales bacterium]|nr:glycerol-3-phosphate acyltransferase [Acidimicrobiales bacterium]
MDIGWALVVPAYLVGTFPTAILVGRRQGRDPTVEGSGNPGASNTMRTMGRRAGFAVLAGDLGKGAAAAGAGWALAGRPVGVACGVAAVLGHVFPATRRFRGGKGVATVAGIALVLVPVPALVLGVLWAVAATATGAASAGSVAVAVGLPVSAAATGRSAGEVLTFAACGALVLARHRDNLDRLRRGEEATFRPPGPTSPERPSGRTGAPVRPDREDPAP